MAWLIIWKHHLHFACPSAPKFGTGGPYILSSLIVVGEGPIIFRAALRFLPNALDSIDGSARLGEDCEIGSLCCSIEASS
ncbi:hypothetical protein HBI09_104730 [Parastagonospora nodorum]|nr:hypothetical protein HBI09_104730 [Parastagonospora nodorum]